MERGACAGHLPCYAACSAHTGEVNFSWWISWIGYEMITAVVLLPNYQQKVMGQPQLVNTALIFSTKMDFIENKIL